MFIRLLPIAVSVLFLAACNSSSGGGAPEVSASTTGTVRGTTAPATTTAAPSPANPSASKLVYAATSKRPADRIEVNGSALAKKHDDGRFVLYVYSNDNDPKPTCEKPIPAEKQGSKGAQIGIVIYSAYDKAGNFAEKTGKFKASDVAIEYHDAAGAPNSESDSHGPDVDITLYDGKTLKATVITPDPPDVDVPRVDGTVVATVCPHKT